MFALSYLSFNIMSHTPKYLVIFGLSNVLFTQALFYNRMDYFLDGSYILTLSEYSDSSIFFFHPTTFTLFCTRQFEAIKDGFTAP